MLTMKALLVFAVVAMVTGEYTRHDLEERSRNAMDACLADKDLNFPDDMKEQMRHPDKVDKPLLGKMAKCTMLKLGYITESGDIVKDAIKNKVKPTMNDPSKFDKLEEMCAKKQESPEETAMFMHKCVREFHEKNCGC